MSLSQYLLKKGVWSCTLPSSLKLSIWFCMVFFLKVMLTANSSFTTERKTDLDTQNFCLRLETRAGIRGFLTIVHKPFWSSKGLLQAEQQHSVLPGWGAKALATPAPLDPSSAQQPHPAPTCAPLVLWQLAEARKEAERSRGSAGGQMLLGEHKGWAAPCQSWLGLQWVWREGPGTEKKRNRACCPGTAAASADGGFWAKLASANPWHAALQLRTQNCSWQRKLPAIAPWGEAN